MGLNTLEKARGLGKGRGQIGMNSLEEVLFINYFRQIANKSNGNQIRYKMSKKDRQIDNKTTKKECTNVNKAKANLNDKYTNVIITNRK